MVEHNAVQHLIDLKGPSGFLSHVEDYPPFVSGTKDYFRRKDTGDLFIRLIYVPHLFCTSRHSMYCCHLILSPHNYCPVRWIGV